MFSGLAHGTKRKQCRCYTVTLVKLTTDPISRARFWPVNGSRSRFMSAWNHRQFLGFCCCSPAYTHKYYEYLLNEHIHTIRETGTYYETGISYPLNKDIGILGCDRQRPASRRKLLPPSSGFSDDVSIRLHWRVGIYLPKYTTSCHRIP
jgi:hypothetical protein